jgi:hypothetical protein
MMVWTHSLFSQRATWPASATVRHASMALTFKLCVAHLAAVPEGYFRAATRPAGKLVYHTGSSRHVRASFLSQTLDQLLVEIVMKLARETLADGRSSAARGVQYNTSFISPRHGVAATPEMARGSTRF